MGIFYEQVRVRNLAPVELSVTYDGQRVGIPVGVSMLPKPCVQYAMNQNPIMGSQDPFNPHISGAKYLVVPVGSKYDREPLTKAEWEDHLQRPCRMDEVALFEEKYGDDPKAKMITRGKGRRTAARTLYEKDVIPPKPELATFERRD